MVCHFPLGSLGNVVAENEMFLRFFILINVVLVAFSRFEREREREREREKKEKKTERRREKKSSRERERESNSSDPNQFRENAKSPCSEFHLQMQLAHTRAWCVEKKENTDSI